MSCEEKKYQVVFLVDVNVDHRSSESADTSPSQSQVISLSALRILNYLFGELTPLDACSRIEALRRKHSSLKWGFKFFDSTRFSSETERRQLKEFRVRNFDEFEKELESRLVSKRGRQAAEHEARTRPGNLTAGECLKRTLTDLLYDFQWESPDITSPVRRSRVAGGRWRPDDVGAHNFVFMFSACPRSSRKLGRFAGKVVTDYKVFLNSFMPPSLYSKFRENQKLAFFWIDTKGRAQSEKATQSDFLKGLKTVEKALSKLGGSLIPVDAIINRGNIYWSSVHSLAKEEELQSSTSLPVQLDFSIIRTETKAKEAPCKKQNAAVALLPLSTTLNHYLNKNICACENAQVQATLFSEQSGKCIELCKLFLVPVKYNTKDLTERVSSVSPTCSEDVSKIYLKFSKSSPTSCDMDKESVCFHLSNIGSDAPFNSILTSQDLELHTYSYLSTNDTSLLDISVENAFICKAHESDKDAQTFQNVILQLNKENTLLMMTLKKNGEHTPYLVALQPLSISLGVLIILSLGTTLKIEKLLTVKRHGIESQETSKKKPTSITVFHWQSKQSALNYFKQKLGKIKADNADVSKQKESFTPRSLDKWNLLGYNPKIVNLVTKLNKRLQDTVSFDSDEVKLLKQLKKHYCQENNPSQLLEQHQEETGLITERQESLDVFQSDPTKLQNFSFVPTRGKMILSKSRQVVEERSKVEKDFVDEEKDDSQKEKIQPKLLLKTKFKEVSELVQYLKEVYQECIQKKTDVEMCIYCLVTVSLNYMMEHEEDNHEQKAGNLLNEEVCMTGAKLRQKYQNRLSEIDKQQKIQEYQLQIFLRLEMKSVLQMYIGGGEEENDMQEKMVDEIIMMLRTLSFITDVSFVPDFLDDVLLKRYGQSCGQTLATVYNELMQPLPCVLAAFLSPGSDQQSTFCSSVHSGSLEKDSNECFIDSLSQPFDHQFKNTRSWSIVLPSLADRSKRQILIGKINQNKKIHKRNQPSEKTEKNSSNARRSLFTGKKTKLDRHATIAVMETTKVASDVFLKEYNTVAETPAHKQVARSLQRFKRRKSFHVSPSTVEVVEESPVKLEDNGSIQIVTLKKPTVALLRRSFYGGRGRSKSRNLAKYLQLADRIAGRHRFTNFSISQPPWSSPPEKPSQFILSELMSTPSPIIKTSDQQVQSNFITPIKPNVHLNNKLFKECEELKGQHLVKQALFKSPEKLYDTSEDANFNTNATEASKSQQQMVLSVEDTMPEKDNICQVISCEEIMNSPALNFDKAEDSNFPLKISWFDKEVGVCKLSIVDNSENAKTPSPRKRCSSQTPDSLDKWPRKKRWRFETDILNSPGAKQLNSEIPKKTNKLRDFNNQTVVSNTTCAEDPVDFK